MTASVSHRAALLLACALLVAGVGASDLWCGVHSCYDVLGVAPNATGAEVKKAYRRSSLKWHPDKNPSAEAKDEFAKLARAYEILSEPRRREVWRDVTQWYHDHGCDVMASLFNISQHPSCRFGPPCPHPLTRESDAHRASSPYHEDYDYALAHPEEEWLNRARFYRDKYFNAGYLQIGLAHIFLGVVAVGSVFQYLNMHSNYAEDFTAFKLTSHYKTEWKRVAAELKLGGGNGNGKKHAALKPGRDAAVDKAVDDRLRAMLVKGGSLTVPSLRRTMAVQVFTVPIWLLRALAAQLWWYWRYQVRKLPYSDADKAMLAEKTLRRLDGGELWRSMGEEERAEVRDREVWVPENFVRWQRELEARSPGGKRRQRY